MGKRFSAKDVFGVLKAAQSAYDESESVISILVLVDVSAPRDLVCAVRDALIPERGQAEVSVASLEQSSSYVGTPQACIILCGEETNLIADAAFRLTRKRIPVALIAETSLSIPTLGQFAELPVAVICSADHKRTVKELAQWLLASVDNDLAVAANFSFCRDAEVKKLSNSCGLQCAAIGALGLSKGADFTVMSVNQSKLALEIAAVYGKDLDIMRFADIAIVLGTGLVWRTLARKTQEYVPGVSWAVRALIAYLGTRTTATALNALMGVSEEQTGLLALREVS